MNQKREEGIALITVLLLLVLLMGIMVVTMNLTLSNVSQSGDSVQQSRTLAIAQGGRNFGQSLLQGHVGTKLSDAIVDLAASNTIGNAATWVFAPSQTGTTPPPLTVATNLRTLATNIQSRMNGRGCYGPFTVSGTQQFSLRISFTGQLPACDGQEASTAEIGTGRFISGATNSTQQYSLPYVMVVSAQDGLARRTLTVNGEYRFNVGNGSFARFALLTDAQQSGTSANIFFTSRTLFNGPVHTNGNFAFRDNPYFGGSVSSSGVTDRRTAGGYFSNTYRTCERYYGCYLATDSPFRTPSQLNPPSYGTTTPDFMNGVNWNAPPVDFPTNSNNQAAAAQAAGLYISSGTTVTLSVGNGESGTPMAGVKYQAINVGTTRYRSVENGPLYRWDGSSWVIATNSTGQPINRFNGVVYANGGLTSLKGPPRTTATPPVIPPAVASFSQLTIAANADIRITGDLKYEDNPCDGALRRNSDGTVNVPNCSSDPLIQKNVLGVYTSSGDIKIGAGHSTTSNLNVPKDVQIQATLMADSEVRVENAETVSCNAYGTAYVLGGVISRNYGQFGTFNRGDGSCSSGLGRSFTYDQRMLNGLAPPYFPTTQMTNLLVDRQVIQYGQTEQERR
ncbi:DUF4900 domain-containing protein [Deinococcus taklimakanensis]|uniref:DUF4900 domain-containing protein n=1 Tax=Deinococcus taklimakanensis TaxID=536443 RepID=A0ABW5P390_9DEIO